MKRITLSLFLIVVANIMSAQVHPFGVSQALDTITTSKLTAVYLYTIKTEDAEGQPVTDSISLALQVGDGMWKCTPYDRHLILLGRGEDLGEAWWKYMVRECQMHVPTIVTNYPEGKITSHEAVMTFCFKVVEDKKPIKWKMNDEPSTVCGYACKSAVGDFHGKTWNVQYTEEVPTSAGPWKLSGLPGLITSATDNEGIHSFVLTNLMVESTPLTYEKFYIVNRMRWDGNDYQIWNDKVEFEKRTLKQLLDYKQKTLGNRKFLSNPRQFLPPVDGSTSIICSDSAEILNGAMILNSMHKYQPLELK